MDVGVRDALARARLHGGSAGKVSLDLFGFKLTGTGKSVGDLYVSFRLLGWQKGVSSMRDKSGHQGVVLPTLQVRSTCWQEAKF